MDNYTKTFRVVFVILMQFGSLVRKYGNFSCVDVYVVLWFSAYIVCRQQCVVDGAA